MKRTTLAALLAVPVVVVATVAVPSARAAPASCAAPALHAPTVLVRGHVITVSGGILTSCQDLILNGQQAYPAPLRHGTTRIRLVTLHQEATGPVNVGLVMATATFSDYRFRASFHVPTRVRPGAYYLEVDGGSLQRVTVR